MFFNQLGFDYIDNSTYYSLQELEFDPLVQINNQADAINVYIVDIAPYKGRANGIGSQALVVKASNALGSTLPHEVGHCLNLLHTFQGTAANTSGCAEFIGEIYPNCKDCGDEVCDTPADDGNQNDNGYQPDLTNNMSYYDNRDHFTIGQELRMRDALAALSILQNVVGNSCGIVEGDTVTCSNLNTVLTLTNSTPPYYWEVINGSMEIIGSNTGNSVTIAALNSSISEQGAIEVSYGNGGLEHFNIWIGKPLALETGSIVGPDVVDTASIVAYHYESGEEEEDIGATTYEWWLPYPYNVVSPIDYYGDNWQVSVNLGIGISHVFTGYGENDGYIQVMAKNKCGLGGAKIMAVAHGNCTGPGCGGSAIVPPNPIPNSSNTSFSLDFTTYPVGTYYIYIYDINYNTVYSGATSNIEKTVETSSIPSGTYYLHIHDGNDIYTQQLIITH